MEEPQDYLRAALKALDQNSRRVDKHLTEEELAAYHARALPIERHEDVQDHLVSCRDCREMLLDYVAWVEAGQETSTQDPVIDVTAAWARVCARLGAGESGETTKSVFPNVRPENDQSATDAIPVQRKSILQGMSHPRTAYALAASFFLVSLALGAWNWSQSRTNRLLSAQLAQMGQSRSVLQSRLDSVRHQLDDAESRWEDYESQVAALQQEVEGLSGPEINIPIVDLQPHELIRGASNAHAVQPIELPLGCNFFTLVLNVGELSLHRNYAIEVRNRRGELVWRRDGLRRTEFNNFTVMMPSRLFPSGVYRVTLYGIGTNTRTLIEHYTVRIRYL